VAGEVAVGLDGDGVRLLAGAGAGFAGLVGCGRTSQRFVSVLPGGHFLGCVLRDGGVGVCTVVVRTVVVGTVVDCVVVDCVVVACVVVPCVVVACVVVDCTIVV
jgi:hypothetical protein